MTRSNLKLVIFLLVAIFSIAFIFVLLSGMSPSARTKNKEFHGVFISSKNINRTIDYDGIPIFISKSADLNVTVLNLIPVFKKSGKLRCLIVPMYDDGFHIGFADPCEGTRYSSDGEVVGENYSSALPMNNLNWEIKGNYIVVSKDT